MTKFHRDDQRTLSPVWERPVGDVKPAGVHPAGADHLHETFAEQGFVVVDGLFDADELASVARNVERYRRFVAPQIPREDWVRYEGDGAVANMYFLDRTDPFFSEFGARQRLIDLVSRVTGHDVSFQNAETFDKPAGSGSASVPHQDGIYFEGRPDRFLHIWMPLDRADLSNGGMLHWPGSHHLGLRDHYRIEGDPDLGGIPDELLAELGPPLAGEVSPGQAIIHGDRIVHGSNPNRSSSRRRALALAYFHTN